MASDSDIPSQRDCITITVRNWTNISESVGQLASRLAFLFSQVSSAEQSLSLLSSYETIAPQSQSQLLAIAWPCLSQRPIGSGGCHATTAAVATMTMKTGTANASELPATASISCNGTEHNLSLVGRRQVVFAAAALNETGSPRILFLNSRSRRRLNDIAAEAATGV